MSAAASRARRSSARNRSAAPTAPPPPSSTPASTRASVPAPAPASERGAAPASPSAPTVAVLCDPAHGAVAASAVALALADACGSRCALAASVGHGAIAAVPAGPAVRRAAAALVGRGYDAAAVGRLVWLADLRVTRRRADDPRPLADDPVGAVAAAALEVAGASRALGAPAALAIPLARSDALDRVLGWHDAIVVVEDGRTTTAELAELVTTSLAQLGRPVAAMGLASRLRARLTVAGLGRPATAVRAVADLGLASA